MTTVNLDAARAARRPEAPTVVLDGREFTLAAELPFSAILDLRELNAASKKNNLSKQAEAIASVMRALLGDEFDAFMALAPSLEDLVAVIEGVMPAYGGDLPESSASPNS